MRFFTRSNELLTRDDRKRMLENGRRQTWGQDEFKRVLGPEREFPTPEASALLPVVKLFTPDADCVWLFATLDPANPDIAFGLHDLGMGCPVVGTVRISEIEDVRGREGKGVQRDPRFVARKTLAEYAEEAEASGRIEA